MAGLEVRWLGGGGAIATKNVVWFKSNAFQVASITKDHNGDNNQDYLGEGGGPCPPPQPPPGYTTDWVSLTVLLVWACSGQPYTCRVYIYSTVVHA